MLHRDAPATAGDLADTMLEPLDGFRCHVNGRSRFAERESKKLEFLASHHSTLLLVHDQVKLVGKVPRDRRHDPLGTTLRLGEDREVIGVSHEVQAPPLELFVQIIQEDVGEQG